MEIGFISLIQNLTTLQKILFILTLVLPWFGICFSFLLHNFGIIEDPGNFIWGSIVGSFTICALALLFEKKDFVSILTPVYAIIIFFSMELPWTVLLQFLFACTLTVLLWRLITRFGSSKSIQYV